MKNKTVKKTNKKKKNNIKKNKTGVSLDSLVIKNKPLPPIEQLQKDIKDSLIEAGFIRQYFDPKRGLDNYTIFYNLVYYIVREAAFYYMPISMIKIGLENSSNEVLKHELNYIANKFGIIAEKADLLPDPETNTKH